MNKIKYIIGILIVIVGMLCFNLLNREYFQKEDKRNINAQYLALDGETALKNITIKKEMIEPKEYYTAGDEIKYKFTVTNNNSETVKVNLIDNINNLEKIQRNLVLKSAKCNDESITINSNQIKLSNYEMSGNSNVACEVDALAKKNYSEGKVRSRTKIYIDYEDEFIEDSFEYLVRDSILDIQLNSIDKFNYDDSLENTVYQLKIKNLSETEASGRIEFSLNNTNVKVRLDDRSSTGYSYEFTGALNKIVENSKIKMTCKTSSGDTCVTDSAQYLDFTILGLNPGETITLNVKYYYNATISSTISSSIKEYKKDSDEILKETKRAYNFSSTNSYDNYPSMYPVDKNGNRLEDFYDLIFVNGKAQFYLNNNFYRLKYYDATRTDAAPFVRITLPSNIEYDDTRSDISSSCRSSSLVEGFKVDKRITASNLYYLDIACGLGTEDSNYVYFANVKVPLTVTKKLVNTKTCLVPNVGVNSYCLGSDFQGNSLSMTQDAKGIIDVSFNVYNDGNLGIGAKDVTATIEYPHGLAVDKTSLGEDAVINTSKSTITWTIPLVKTRQSEKISFKMKNTGNLEKAAITYGVEGSTRTETIYISKIEEEYLKGDWNLNGTVNINDAIYARKYIARLGDVVLPPAQVYDLNGDNNPTISDLVLLRKLISEGKN